MKDVIRWLLGLAMIAKGFESLAGTSGSGGHFGVMGSVLFAFAFIISGAVVLSPDLARWAATPFTRFIDSIYLPGGRTGDKPEPNYRLADYYYRTLQHDLAIEEYEKIIHYHPGEKRAYIALVDLWTNQKREPARAAKLYRRGLRKVPKGAARRELREAYRSGHISEYVESEQGAPENDVGGQANFPDLR